MSETNDRIRQYATKADEICEFILRCVINAHTFYKENANIKTNKRLGNERREPKNFGGETYR